MIGFTATLLRRTSLLGLLLVLGTTLLAPPAWAHDETPANRFDDAWAGQQAPLLSGRVIERGRATQDGGDAASTTYRTLRATLTRGLGHQSVQVSLGGAPQHTLSDYRGYWTLRWAGPRPAAGWHPLNGTPAALGDAALLVPDPRNRVGIISDLDDTVQVSHVLDKGRLLRNSLSRGPSQRVAVPGMASWYRQILAANPHPESAPMFYVSASPRELGDNLRRFLALNQFPRGALVLKTIRGTRPDSLSDQQGYKLGRVRAVLQDFPQVRFHLVGDDGERDPEVFRQLQQEFPKQVIAVWIRQVHTDPQRARYAEQRPPPVSAKPDAPPSRATPVPAAATR